jgi:hypothetical protein
MGEKLFAVPWSTLTLDTVNKRFVLAVDKERLSQAPGFDKDNWTDMQDPTWSQEIHAYYGTKPYVDDRLKTHLLGPVPLCQLVTDLRCIWQLGRGKQT